MATKFVVGGFKQMQANLRSIPRALAGNGVDRVALNALKPMHRETERLARVRRQPGTPKGGHLDQNVVSLKVGQKSRYVREYWVSFKGRGRKLAHLVEYGTAPHWQPNRFGGIWHPGARQLPFFRPAFESKKHDAVTILAAGIWDLIENSLTVNTRGRGAR